MQIQIHTPLSTLHSHSYPPIRLPTHRPTHSSSYPPILHQHQGQSARKTHYLTYHDSALRHDTAFKVQYNYFRAERGKVKGSRGVGVVEGKGREGEGREGEGGKGRGGKGREGEGREGKGKEGKEGKGRESEGDHES